MSHVPGAQTLRLLPAMLRFVVRDGIRPRRVLLLGAVAGVGALELLLAVRGRADAVGSSVGAFLVIGSLVAAAPLCRSWLDEDVRLGYGAFWLQKPVSPVELYLARLLAAMALGVVIAVGLVLAMVPAVILGPSTLERLAGLIVVATPIPPLLIALSFLGSGLGARNGALFAYLMLLLGFWLRAFLASMGADVPAVLGLIESLLPPVRSLLDAGDRVARDGLVAAALGVAPVVGYVTAVAAAGLLLTLRVPGRLGRAE